MTFPWRCVLGVLLFARLAHPWRVLVVTIDHRELDGELRNASHPSLSAVINYNYAKLHGYDYKYFHPVINETEVRQKYKLKKPIAAPPPPPPEEEDSSSTSSSSAASRRRRRPVAAPHAPDETPTAFHPGLKEFRGSSWCRLPTLWHLTRQYVDKYDALLVIDSDLVMSAVHQNTSVEQKLSEWQSRSDGVTWGPKGPELASKAAIIFFPNSPFGNWEPATGILLIRPKLNAAAMIKEWWDFDWPEKSFSLMHEQDALWRVYQWSPQTVFQLNQANTAMVSERQFPVDMTVDEWCLRKAWICHVSHSWGKDRNRIFHRILHSEVLHLHSTQTRLSSDAHAVASFFHDTIALIRASEVQFDVLRAAEDMEANGGPRKQIGNHVPQHTDASAPAAEAGKAMASSPSAAPAPGAPDPEEQNNEFHNLNPSTVEEPTKDRWEVFTRGTKNLVESMSKLKSAASEAPGATPKQIGAAALHRNYTLGRISHDSFLALYSQWAKE